MRNNQPIAVRLNGQAYARMTVLNNQRRVFHAETGLFFPPFFPLFSDCAGPWWCPWYPSSTRLRADIIRGFRLFLNGAQLCQVAARVHLTDEQRASNCGCCYGSRCSCCWRWRRRRHHHYQKTRQNTDSERPHRHSWNSSKISMKYLAWKKTKDTTDFQKSFCLNTADQLWRRIPY